MKSPLSSQHTYKQQNRKQNVKQLAALKKEQSKLKSRLDELGKIMKKLYEDNALSRITDEQYTHLSSDFVTERQQAEQRLGKAVDFEHDLGGRIFRFASPLNLVNPSRIAIVFCLQHPITHSVRDGDPESKKSSPPKFFDLKPPKFEQILMRRMQPYFRMAKTTN